MHLTRRRHATHSKHAPARLRALGSWPGCRPRRLQLCHVLAAQASGGGERLPDSCSNARRQERAACCSTSAPHSMQTRRPQHALSSWQGMACCCQHGCSVRAHFHARISTRTAASSLYTQHSTAQQSATQRSTQHNTQHTAQRALTGPLPLLPPPLPPAWQQSS